MIEPISDWLFYLLLALFAGMPILHFTLGPGYSKKSRVVITSLALLLLCWMVIVSFFPVIPLRDMLLMIGGFCIASFTALSEVLMRGGGEWLTRKRGEKWTKEIDYVYLMLGAVGLLISVGQLSIVANKISLPSTLGPIALALALVLRAIKTRAEIAGWNKLPPRSPQT